MDSAKAVIDNKTNETNVTPEVVELPAKQVYKNFTINPDSTTSKYINKLKQLYNKDWGSSYESISQTLQKSNSANNKFIEDSSKQNSKYIKKLLNTYEQSDLIENSKVANDSVLNENSSNNNNNNKINKLKEKFAAKQEKIEPLSILNDQEEPTNSNNNKRASLARQKYQKAKTVDLSDFISWTPNNLPETEKIENIVQAQSHDVISNIDSMKVHSDSQLLVPVAPKKSILKIPATVIEKSLTNVNNPLKQEIIKPKPVEHVYVPPVTPLTNENKNRNRFKKKVTVRSHSVEIGDFKNIIDEDDLIEPNNFEKPNLQDQNVIKAKSYADNLHKTQDNRQQPKIIVKTSSLSSFSSTRSSASISSSSESSSISSDSTSLTELSQAESNCEICQSIEKDKRHHTKKSSKRDHCKKCEKRRRHHHHHHHKQHAHHRKGHHHHHHHNNNNNNHHHRGKNHHHQKKDTFNNMIDSIKTSLNDFNDFYTIKNKKHHESSHKIMHKYYSSDDSICGIPKTIPK